MTDRYIIRSEQGVTVLGGGLCTSQQLDAALACAPMLVAANGGAANAQSMGRSPVHVVGDGDSLPAENLGKSINYHRIREQDTTDFDKCIRSIEAPIILGVGVLAPRLDHGLASLGALLKFADRRIVLIGDGDVCAVIPPRMRMTVARGTRLSVFPFVATHVWSEGLKWEMDGLYLSPHGMLGVSNRVVDEELQLRQEHPGCLVIVPIGALTSLVRALGEAAAWPETPSPFRTGKQD